MTTNQQPPQQPAQPRNSWINTARGFIWNHKLFIALPLAITVWYFESGKGKDYPEERYAENRLKKIIKDEFRDRQDKVEEIVDPNGRIAAYWNNKIVHQSRLNEVENLPKACPEDVSNWQGNRQTMDISACAPGQGIWIQPQNKFQAEQYAVKLYAYGPNDQPIEVIAKPVIKLLREQNPDGFSIANEVSPGVWEVRGEVQFIPEGNAQLFEWTKQ